MKSIALKIILFSLLLIASACRENPDLPPEAIAPGAVKLLVSADGFYQITQRDLSRAGLDITDWSVENISLTTNDTAVPYHLTADSLTFYGQAPTSRYTAIQPYILRSGTPGQQMATSTMTSATSPTTNTQTSIPIIRHLEDNTLYEPRALTNTPAEDSDLWFWGTISHQQQFPIEFDLPTVSDGSGSLTIALWGFTHNPSIDPDHDLDIILNNQRLDTIRWDGETTHTATLTIPPGTLTNGRNTLILDNTPESAAIPDIMRLNWVDITYSAPTTAVSDQLITQIDGTILLEGFSAVPTLYDISDPAAPTRLLADPAAPLTLTQDIHLAAIGPNAPTTPTIAPLRASDWTNPANAADLIILTTDQLAPALEPLAAHHRDQGLQVAIIPVAEIYDEFGAGSATPAAIQQFIAHAITNWATPPRYLHIVADATSDYRNYLGNAPANTIPAPMVPVQFGGETVSDSQLVDINAEHIPDLAVGRWPVRTIAEVEDLVTRTIAYEAGTAVPHTIFTADASEARFAPLATQIAESSGINTNQLTVLEGPTAADLATAWNEGTWLATYVGHGSVQQWGQDQFVTVESASGLTASQPPIVVQLTCLTGLFADPTVISLSETLLTQPNGPVLIIAATSLTLSDNQQPFAIALLQAMQDPTITRIGDAFQIAKTSLDITNPGLREISDTFILIGDPAAQIVRPATDSE